MLVILCVMLGNTKIALCAWHWLLAEDVSLVVYITDPFMRLYNCDEDRQRDILEIKHIFTILQE